MDSQKVLVRAALQRLGEEFQAMCGASWMSAARMLLMILDARKLLVSPARSPLAKSLDVGKDRVGGGGPDEGLGLA